ncbi:MAG TPA: SGNH/GDSL hydrolase family protein [Xanthobacteraceae bacterium]|nr:SGNH/GDSL hydrolase family protein [Xanthobacteraceae bacterium]
MLARTMLAVALLLLPAAARTQESAATGWIASWIASPQPRWEGDFPLPVLAPPTLWNQTVRQRVRLSLGGTRLRLVLSNRYGDTPVRIGAASVARAGTKAGVAEDSLKAATFGGQPSTTLLPGTSVISDPVEIDAPALSELAVSLFVPQPTAVSTFHWDGGQTAYIAAGNATVKTDLEPESTTTTRIALSGVLVEAPAQTATIVAFGDSITDGAASTLDANRRWPDFLAARLAPQGIAVVNAGISGNRLLAPRMGESALARFDRDVASLPGVAAVVVLIGINDISWPGHAFAPDIATPSADQLIDGYRQLAALARARNIRILGATLTPFEGALKGTPFEGYYTPDKDRVRQQVNERLRADGVFDALVDLDAVLRDPEHPRRLHPEFDSGDHLHASDRGNAAIADAIDLRLLLGR